MLKYQKMVKCPFKLFLNLVICPMIYDVIYYINLGNNMNLLCFKFKHACSQKLSA